MALLQPSSQTSTRSFLDWGVSFIIKRLHLSKWSQRRRTWIKVAMLGIWPRRRPTQILFVPQQRGKTWKFSTLLSWTFPSKIPAPVSMLVKLMWNRTPIITVTIQLQGQSMLRSSIRAAIMSNKRTTMMSKRQKRRKVLWWNRNTTKTLKRKGQIWRQLKKSKRPLVSKSAVVMILRKSMLTFLTSGWALLNEWKVLVWSCGLSWASERLSQIKYN